MSPPPDVPPPRNIHDALVRFAFSNPRHAESLLRSVLPAQLAGRIDWSSLSLRRAAFVGTKLRSRYADLLFSVLIGGRAGFIHVLFEHQSSDDPLICLRLLEYMAGEWRAEAGRQKPFHALPVIIPVVLQHGKKGRRKLSSFRTLFRPDKDFWRIVSRFVPDFKVIVQDLRGMDTETIAALPMREPVLIVLYCLRWGHEAKRDPDGFFRGLGRWAEALAAMAQDPEEALFLKALVQYMKRVTGRNDEDVTMALRAVSRQQEDVDRIMNPDKWIRIDTQREMLVTQFGVRFGELPKAVVDQVNSADADQIQAMSRRIVLGGSLEEVLACGVKPPRNGRRRTASQGEEEAHTALRAVSRQEDVDRIMNPDKWLRIDGQREMLVTQFGVRFGELPEAVVNQVKTADPDQIQAMLRSFALGGSLEEVLASGAKPPSSGRRRTTRR